MKAYKILEVKYMKNRAGYVTPVHERDYKMFEHCNHNDNNRYFATEYDFGHYVWPLMRMHGYTSYCLEIAGDRSMPDEYAAIKKLSEAERDAALARERELQRRICTLEAKRQNACMYPLWITGEEIAEKEGWDCYQEGGNDDEQIC